MSPYKKRRKILRLYIRAEDGAQTRDPQLGRLMLYQLSYFRKILSEFCEIFASLGITKINFVSALVYRKNSAYLELNYRSWAVMDSNHRSRKTAELQSAPFGHSGNCPKPQLVFRIASAKLQQLFDITKYFYHF